MTIDEIRLLALNLSREERKLSELSFFRPLVCPRIRKNMKQLGTRKSLRDQMSVGAAV